MENQTNEVQSAFVKQLIDLNRSVAEIFKTGDITNLTRMNKIIKEMYRLQHASEDPALAVIDGECKIIYSNFDMIVAVLRTTEDGIIDKGAQKALNKFLHNIHEATVDIASTFGLI